MTLHHNTIQPVYMGTVSAVGAADVGVTNLPIVLTVQAPVARFREALQARNFGFDTKGGFATSRGSKAHDPPFA